MTFDELRKQALLFRDERDWGQFHNPKDLALSICLEAAELLECFQWSGADLDVENKREAMIEELADIFNYCLLLADTLDVDIVQATSNKIKENQTKYPQELAKGNSKKYTDLHQ